MSSEKYLARVVGVVGVVFALASCAPIDDEAVAGEPSALFINGGFEGGAPNNPPPAPWLVSRYYNPLNTGFTPQTPQTFAGLNLTPGGVPNTVLLAAAGPSSQMDMAIGAAGSLRWPRYGNFCVVVNGPSSSAQSTTGAMENVNTLTQTMTIGAGDVDPTDGQVHIRFVMAPVLMNPAHVVNQQPYYFVEATNVTRGNATLYNDFNLSTAGGTWNTVFVGGNQIDYLDWTLVDIAPGSAAIAMGDQVVLRITAAGCSQGAHWGEIYVDGIGATIQGITVQASAPAQANAGALLTYALHYRNGSPLGCTTAANCMPNTSICSSGACSETNVVIDFPTPPNTTFQSLAPPVGATCVTPAVGAVGTIVCTVTGPFRSSLVGDLSITVRINPGTGTPIVAGNYDIHSTQEPRLVGPAVHTRVGCMLDVDCTAGNWCNETAHVCVPRLTNGMPMPRDAAHTAPTLNGTCTAAAGALVCASGVCDTADNRCGYANADGPCTAANGSTVCRSAVCDPDLRCGYVNGDGPCTVATGGVVCRSGACSVSGVCQPAGGCSVDGDCSVANWCNETAHACTPRLGNGMTLPSDPAHTAPTLNGTCTAAAGAVVCVSGVCGTADNRCGLANQDGPCTAASGPAVCRSGACSVSGTCEPSGGCNVDGDCAVGNWCNEQMHMCLATLPNGVAMPTDATHTSPTLDGTCTASAAALVCTSGVCDAADARCGYANGDGPCTAASGMAVCRSAICATSGALAGLCVACVDVTTCAGATPVCDVTMGACVQCTATSAAACGGSLPVCTSDACVGCSADFGASTGSACPSSASPFCTSLGTCDHCAADADCRSGTHTGPICNAMTGACGTQCSTDANCDPGHWCNDVGTPGTGTCGMLLPNGDPLPGGTCTATLGTRACASGICASTGPNAGHCEQCASDAQCGGATPTCDAATSTCVAANHDAGVGDAGAVVMRDGGAGDGSVRDAGSTDTGASGMDTGVAPPSAGGCSCRAAGSSGPSRSLLAMLFGALMIARRRLRARRR